MSGGLGGGFGGGPGPTGPTGPGGGSGATGPTGATGAAGAVGPTGPAGSANASGTGGTIGKFTGAGASTTVGDSGITDDGTTVSTTEALSAGVTTVTKSAIASTKTTGLIVKNATSTASGATVQISPSIVLEGRAKVSGSDTAFEYRLTIIPTTGGNVSILFEYSTNGGSTYSTAWQHTTATPGQFVTALLASGIACSSGSTGIFFDADQAGLFRGGSGDLQIFARAASLPMLLRSPVTAAAVAAFLFYANGDTRGAGNPIAEFGDVAAGEVMRAQIMGDGSYNGPLSVVTATPKTANYTAVARDEVWLNTTGGAFDFTLPTAVGAAGKPIRAHMTTTSANVATLKTTSGQTISGSASGALTLGNAVSIETGRFSSDGANWWLERTTT